MENRRENGNETDKHYSKIDCSPNEIHVPVDIFSNDASGLESLSHYLKGVLGLRFCEIADVLNRDDRTVWGANKGAEEKLNSANGSSDSRIRIPISIFRDRSLSVLEALSEYLKECQNMRYCRIAALLNKDQRTIWTVYSRAKKKRGQRETSFTGLPVKTRRKNAN